jgi:hypothetical protein
MTRRAQIAFVSWFVATLFLVPVSQAIFEVMQGGVPQCFDIFRRIPSAENLRSFERSLESASIFAAAIRPKIQAFWFFTLRYPGEKAIAGHGDWFFYKPDVRYLIERGDTGRDQEHGENPLNAITKYRDDLSKRGIRLLVVPVPGKPSIYSDKLTGRVKEGDSFRSQTQDLIAQLRARGVETADLFGVFRGLRRGRNETAYLERDSHWSGETCAYAARLVADKLRELNWAPAASTEFEARPVIVKRRGDILRMIGAPQIERLYQPEEVRCLQVSEKETGKLYKDDAQSPVLVLGDSFLRMYQTDEPLSAGFIAYLAKELGVALASIVNDGGASTLVRQELMRRPELVEKKKVVIWEFVERDLRFGTEGWKEVPLPERITTAGLSQSAVGN